MGQSDFQFYRKDEWIYKRCYQYTGNSLFRHINFYHIEQPGGNDGVDSSGNLLLNNDIKIKDDSGSFGSGGQYLGLEGSGFPQWQTRMLEISAVLLLRLWVVRILLFLIAGQGTNNTTAVSNILQTAINTIGLNGTNNLNSSNAVYQVQFTTLGKQCYQLCQCAWHDHQQCGGWGEWQLV